MLTEEVQLTQTAVTKYSETFLFGFDALVSKSENGLQILKDLMGFFRTRATAEEQYAKTLTQLYKSPIGTGLFSKETALNRETKTLRDSILSIQEKSLKIAEQHQEVANKINNDIVKLLDNWVKNKDKDRKKIIVDGQKFQKIIQDSKANVVKTKAAYDAAMKEGEAAKGALEKAEKDQQAQSDNKKLPPITKKAQERLYHASDKAKKAEAAYQAAVKKANDDLEVFKRDQIPGVLDQFQKWEEERWNVTLTASKTYNSAISTVPSVIDGQSKALLQSIETANIEEDFKEFAEAAKNSGFKEEPIQFAQYKGNFKVGDVGQEDSNKEDKKEEEETPTQQEQKSEVQTETKEEPKEEVKRKEGSDPLSPEGDDD